MVGDMLVITDPPIFCEVLLDNERREQQFGDDASTDAGSDLPELLGGGDTVLLSR